jgi:hypothetical protein
MCGHMSPYTCGGVGFILPRPALSKVTTLSAPLNPPPTSAHSRHAPASPSCEACACASPAACHVGYCMLPSRSHATPEKTTSPSPRQVSGVSRGALTTPLPVTTPHAKHTHTHVTPFLHEMGHPFKAMPTACCTALPPQLVGAVLSVA